MKKIILFALFTFMTISMYSQNSFTINLLTKEKITPPEGEQFSTSNEDYAPYIQIYLPKADISTKRAIVICPGGGYVGLAMQHEGVDWVEYFNKQGIAAVILKYRMPKGNYNIPLGDAEAALQILHDHAAEWNINPSDIGIMGFSAGGHLASTVATHTKASLKPNFQILFYPVITMDKTFTHSGSRSNLLGKEISGDLETLFSNEKQVTADAPPAIIISSADDTTVPIANSIRYFEALQHNKIYTSMLIYPVGGHGWGFRTSFPYHDVMLEELSTWLGQVK